MALGVFVGRFVHRAIPYIAGFIAKCILAAILSAFSPRCTDSDAGPGAYASAILTTDYLAPSQPDR